MKNRPIVRYEVVLGGAQPPLSRRSLKILAILIVGAIVLTTLVALTDTREVLGAALLAASSVTVMGECLALWRDIMLRVHARLLRSTLPDRVRLCLFLATLFGIAFGWIAAVLTVIALFGRP